MSNMISDTHRILGRQHGIDSGDVAQSLKDLGDQVQDERREAARRAAPLYIEIDGKTVGKAFNPTDAIALRDKHSGAIITTIRNDRDEIGEEDSFSMLYLSCYKWSSKFKDAGKSVVELDHSELVVEEPGIEVLSGTESIPTIPWKEFKLTL